MNCRLLALDLDGTTLRTDDTLSDTVRDALKNAICHGIEVVIASGRGFTALHRDVISIRGIRYAITSNGAEIYEISNKRRVYSVKLLPWQIDEMLRLLEPYPNMIELFIDGQPITDKRYFADPVSYGTPAYHVPYVRNTRKPVDDIKEYAASHKSDIEAFDVLVVERGFGLTVEKLFSAIPDLYITSSIDCLVEVMHCNAGKGKALVALAKKLGVSVDNVVSVGNASNDIDMIQSAALGCAVENSPKNVTDKADLIIPSNDDDGVAYIINKLLQGV